MPTKSDDVRRSRMPDALGGSPDEHLPRRVATVLQAEITQSKWPVGEVLGSETQLMARFGVSRTVIREAHKILNARGIVRSRSGPGGGLVVTAPDAQQLVDDARLLFDYRGFTLQHLFEIWVAIEENLADRLSREITDAGVADLRQALADAAAIPVYRDREHSVHSEIARLSGNPIGEVFLAMLRDLCHTYAKRLDEEQSRRSFEQHVQLVDAIEAGDGPRARYLVREIFADLQEPRSASAPTGA